MKQAPESQMSNYISIFNNIKAQIKVDFCFVFWTKTEKEDGSDCESPSTLTKSPTAADETPDSSTHPPGDDPQPPPPQPSTNSPTNSGSSPSNTTNETQRSSTASKGILKRRTIGNDGLGGATGSSGTRPQKPTIGVSFFREGPNVISRSCAVFQTKDGQFLPASSAATVEVNSVVVDTIATLGVEDLIEPPSKKPRSRRLNFKDVTVYYFPRTQVRLNIDIFLNYLWIISCKY